MWANLIHVLPAATILSAYETKEEFKMEGNLLSELDRLFTLTVDIEKLKLKKNGPKCTINTIYPAGSNLWTIVDGILVRYQLIPIIETDKNGCITLGLKEGSAWMH